MSSALTGTQIKNTYQSLLKLGGNGSLDPTTPITISDGLGNDTPLQLSGNRLSTYLSASQRGIDLNFASSNYRLGDYNGYSSFCFIDINATGPNIQLGLFSANSNLLLEGVGGNTFSNLTGSYTLSGLNRNYIFGSDWTLFPNSGNYPFEYNTLINTFGALTISDKAMINNLFINNEQITLTGSPSLLNNESTKNCFIFGLSEDVDVNNLNIYNSIVSTNVVVLNGSDLNFDFANNNIFSVNASSLNIESDSTGINIIGGDYMRVADLQPANHLISSDRKSVTVQGNAANVQNSFSRVYATENTTLSTVRGQAQIEDMIYVGYSNSTSTVELTDAVDNDIIYVLSNCTYFVEAKFTSKTAASGANDGNSAIYRAWKVDVNGSGVVTISSPSDIFISNPAGASNIALSSPNPNNLRFAAVADGNNGTAGWMKAHITINNIMYI